MESLEDWVEIIPPTRTSEAKLLYEEWKERRRKEGRSIDEKKVRIDHLLGPAGCTELRYCLLRSEL